MSRSLDMFTLRFLMTLHSHRWNKPCGRSSGSSSKPQLPPCRLKCAIQPPRQEDTALCSPVFSIDRRFCEFLPVSLYLSTGHMLLRFWLCITSILRQLLK